MCVYILYIYRYIYLFNSSKDKMNRRRNVTLSLEIPKEKMAYEGPKPPADDRLFASFPLERKDKEDFTLQIGSLEDKTTSCKIM